MRNLLILFFAFFFIAEATVAQSFFFGKNRVQYERFDWRIIQSDHFDIYYYDSRNYFMAEFAAFSLEAAYKQLSQDFRHEINDRIRVILYDSHSDFSQTNVVQLPVNAQGIGGVTDLFKNRITMPFMSDYAGFRAVLHHELVHAMVNDMYYGGNISILLSEGQRIFPLWFEEGLAEFTALGWDTATDMFMRDAIMNNYLPPLQFLGGFLAYRGGQSFWYFIVEEYGREKIGEIMQRTRMSRNYELALRQSLGLTLDEISNRWKEWLRVRYWPEISERENLNNFAFMATEKRYRGFYNTSPSISPQGDRIAFITNRRGFFDVVVVDALTGDHIKTLIRGEDNVDFEELNILTPNLSWSPDGTRLALSTTSQGNSDIAIVNYETRRVQKLKFPSLDDIRSVAWSPDGTRIAFQGSRGSFVDIYVYDIEDGDFVNITNDIFTDSNPSWSTDSQSILFASDRGARVNLNTHREDFRLLANPDLNQTDIYKVRIGDNRATRLTATSTTNETRPIMLNNGQVIYISDQNGINNVFVLDLNTRISRPVTDLVTGVMQMSATPDGSKLAVNSINGGFLDIFVVDDPLRRVKDHALTPNSWAERRSSESDEDRVPALGYGRNFFLGLFRQDGLASDLDRFAELPVPVEDEQEEEEVEKDSPQTDSNIIDFRNYVFADDIEEQYAEVVREDRFTLSDNKTEDGRFIPKRYRLSFSPDFNFASASVGTYQGVFTFSQVSVSDVLGYHNLSFATNLVFDLRNSNYFLQYAYLRNRTNYVASFSHSAWQFQNFAGDAVRFRNYGFTGGMIYPLNRFERLEFSTGFITLSRDLTSIFAGTENSTDRDYLIYPQLNYIRDVTIPGFLTPQKGTRVAFGVGGSVPATNDFLGFFTASTDIRQYISLAPQYTIALRASGAASFGTDAQSFLLGGVSNWINYRLATQISNDDLASLFFTLPAMPMRGHAYNQSIGDKFALANIEFRFPLFAAIVPGPIPLFPLFNIQGAAFVDVGSTWNGASYNETLAGTGFGLRTILLGLPFRYDLAWPYDVENGSFGSRVHYFSIGIDF